jgi:hypothetical protein
MLRIDTWEGAAAASTVRSVPSPSYYFRHVGESAASLARLVKDNSVEHRCTGRVTAWTRERRSPDGTRLAEDAYAVLGWTSSAILRSSLSSRLDALNPVAASRLLEAPEIRVLEGHDRDFVVLRGGGGLGDEWPLEFAGGISALDLDLWIGSAAADLDGAVALDFDTFRRQFGATEIAV